MSSEQYKEVASRMADVCVEINYAQNTICISDCTSTNEDILLQGDEAYDFIDEVDLLWSELGDITRRTLELALAENYTTCLWY